MLEIQTRHDAATLYVTIRGEADADNSAALLVEASAAISADSRELVIDASELTFADCSTLNCLLELRSYVLSSGGTMTIIKLSPQLRRLLDLTDLLAVFDGPNHGQCVGRI